MASGRQSHRNTDNASYQPSSASEGQVRSENRRARRRRGKLIPPPEPPRSKNHEEATSSTRGRNDNEGNHDKSGSGNGKDSFAETDFIAFTYSDNEEDAPKEERPPTREWDRGKEMEREPSSRKRKAAEIDLNDGYANKKQRLAAASRKAPWVEEVDWERCTNVAEVLQRDVEAFVKYISPTPEEDEVRSLVVTLISRAVKHAFPDAEVLPFGSYETKLYLPIGDIDLVIHSQSMAYSDKETVLHALANTVKRAGITDRVKIIAKAKVPIVKFVTAHGRFSVDISVNQGNGVTAGKMIKQFLAELPALRSLVLVIKSFLSQRSMNEVFTGGLGSYSIVCLVISFLQMHPKIRRGEIDPSKNLGVLVLEFFELYGCYFNYHEVGISLRDGGTYFNKAQRGWLDYGQPKLLSIEDPGDSSNDISRGSYGIAKVRTTLAGAHGIMTAAAYSRAEIVSARRDGRYVNLRRTSHPEDMSILASVMGVTQDTINHRRLVQEVYDRGVLHQILGLTPQVTLPPISTQSSQHVRSRQAREESIRSAWEEADMQLGSDDDSHERFARDEDESRYGIDARRQPSRKRRRIDGQRDMHTVYTTDDEDAEDRVEFGTREEASLRLNGYGQGDGSLDEKWEYDLLDEDDDNDRISAAPRGMRHRSERNSRRDYWLSKGFKGIASDSSGD